MRYLLCLLALLAAPVAPPAQAQDWTDGKTEVDLELILMVDVSRSMSPRELEIQRRGYAEALNSDEVFEAMQSGLLQRVALAYVEWAGWGAHRIIVDWRLLETREDLTAFSETLTSSFNPSLRRTSISGALLHARDSLDDNNFMGLRQVIDVSGDGPNNQGWEVLRARDEVLMQGIIINGLPLMTREGMGANWNIDNLDAYYRDCVIGGPGSFVIPVWDWDDFADAVRRKLVLEMVSAPPPAAAPRLEKAVEDGTDCLIGEKMWQERNGAWMP
ncbi:DUF1194 domain-containing protein [Psychromarinibacter sp. S121]|uniref:DUF1194 domain-containing protein n=1 Tax=Psychromarinibacter sp. S121 TaxID=3415127 RepID=UPI003C7AEB7D